SRWSRPRVKARRRCCRSGPSAAARPSRGCPSMTGTTIRRSCSLTSRKHSTRSSRWVGGCSTRWPHRRVRCRGRWYRGLRGRLAAAFAAMTSPLVLVLDDVHLLGNRVCQDALSVLAEHVPDGSRLVLAGRAEPPLRIARLRAEGRVLEIGPADLSLTLEEAA